MTGLGMSRGKVSSRARIALSAAACEVLLAGCVAPGAFVKTTEPNWSSVEVREDLIYEKAWATVVDTLVKRFDLEVISREDGYIRTRWLYTWTGKATENYRVRIAAKFSPDHRKIEVKSEAEYGGPGKWVMGYDVNLLSTVKSDIMGTIGRPAR